MPKLPDIKPRKPKTIANDALFLACYLAHTTPNGASSDGAKGREALAKYARQWFDENDEAKQQFIEWFEQQ